MIEAPYKSEVITGYLLGSLSAVETEQLDELSITDATFSDALRAAEGDLVDAYVLGELGDEERRLFETRYLASAHGRDKVEFALSLVAYGERQECVEKPGWLEVLKGYLAQGNVLQWGFAAAALVLLVAGSWLAIQNLRLRQQVRAAQAQNNELAQREQQLQGELEARHSTNTQNEQESARMREELERANNNAAKDRPGAQQTSVSNAVLSLTLGPQLRSNAQIPTVSVQPTTTRIAVQLGLEPNPNSNYRVLLVDQVDHQTVWRSSQLKSHANAGGEVLNISFPARLLKPRTYVLRVMGVGANGASEVIGDYSFRVVN